MGVGGTAHFHKAGTGIAPHPKNCSHPNDLRTGCPRGTIMGELRRGAEVIQPPPHLETDPLTLSEEEKTPNAPIVTIKALLTRGQAGKKQILSSKGQAEKRRKHKVCGLSRNHEG